MRITRKSIVPGQFDLGLCYSLGRGVEKDNKEAVKWYRKSAEQGFAPAQYHLSCCYYNGEGVEKNTEEAIAWCRKAAENGYKKAPELLEQMTAPAKENKTEAPE